MLLAGAVAAGAIGHGAGGLGTGTAAYVALASAGTLGYLAGAVAGWAVGRRGGRRPLGTYVALTALGSAIWCFAFAATGWALGTNWDAVHGAFRYADVAAIVLVAGGAVWLTARSRSQTT